MKKVLKFFVFICVLFTSMAYVKAEDLKVIIIEINPLIEKITSSEFSNNGHPKVSEYFKQDPEATINELKYDLESTSHDYLKVNIVAHEYLNEYPTYKEQILLSNGQKSYRFDEDTYLQKAGYDGEIYGNWFNLFNNDLYNDLPAYSFDYDYIINKYNLIERRKNNEFDQVWLLTIDPSQTYETIMVGNNPFWINSPGYIADCQNFVMVNVSISRRDANLHALGHGLEGILNAVFSDKYLLFSAYNDGKFKYYTPSYSSYEKDVIGIDQSNYNKLNYWEKFTLGIYSNSKDYASVGNIHFPFNSEKSYDYSNETKIYTNWQEWLNYPNVNGDFKLDNNTAWLNNAGNDKLGENENKDPDRLYSRFWFYLMPHIEGYTEDGYYNNWWKYFKSLDFVTNIEAVSKTTYNVVKNDEVILDYKLSYNSGKSEIKKSEPQYDNLKIEGNSVSIKDNKIIASNEGTSTVTISHDNKNIVFTINVKNEEKESKKYSCEIVNDKYFGKNGDEISKGEYEKECSNLEPNPNTGYFFPFFSIITLMGIAAVIYFYLKKHKVNKLN